MESLFEQFATITKANAYDIVAQQRNELLTENEKLKARVKYLEDLIQEYTNKMLVNLDSQKVNQFLKDQISETNDDLKDIPIFTNNLNEIP